MNQFISQLKFPSRRGTLAILLLVLFCIELVLMNALPQLFQTGNRILESFVDASLLAILFTPVLHSYVFEPFRSAAAMQRSLTENVLAHLVDGVVLFDELLAIHSFNSAAERIFGYPAGEVIGAEVKLILPDLPDLSDSGREGGDDFSRGGSVRECRGERSDGSKVPVELSLSRLEVGECRMWLGIVRDISARREAEESAKRTLSLLSATLESTADGIMVRDLAGNTVIANKRFGEMWHIPAQLMGTHDDALLRRFVADQLKDPQKFLEATERQYLEPGRETHDQIAFADGRVYERFSWPQVEDDRIVGRVICYRDLTEQRNLEHQLRHAQKMEALGTLAGGVAHDFNNILTVIMGFCNLSSVQLGKESPISHNLDQIMAASERALTLTNSLLAYSRKQIMNPRPLDLNTAVLNTEKFLARLIGEDIELVTRLCGEKMTVMADSGQLEQVLTNLAANARDAMNHRGSLIIATRRFDIGQDFVRLHGYGKPGSFALISVSDTGSGMDRKTREKIFEPFFTTKELGQGTGLGLSIVYGIVKQHDGYINVYSEPGQGTTFNIYLPLIEQRLEAAGEKEQRVAGGTETILLAEDDADVRELVASVLSGAGYRVLEAADGETAVEMFRKNREGVDLLIMDVVMPRKDGSEAFREISAAEPGARAIFISGYTTEILDRNGLAGAGVPLLHKPLLPNQLLAKVREILDERQGTEAEGVTRSPAPNQGKAGRSAATP